MEWLCMGMVAVAAWIIVAGILKGQRVRQAWNAYQYSLRELQQHPTDPDLRARTLSLGRVYSNLSRDGSGRTIFDEVALSNDIGAACAGHAQPQYPTHSYPPPNAHPAAASASPQQRLQKLDQLKRDGLISDQEYAQTRHRILSEI